MSSIGLRGRTGLFDVILEFFQRFLESFGVVGDAMLFFADNYLWILVGFFAFLFLEAWIKRRKRR